MKKKYWALLIIAFSATAGFISCSKSSTASNSGTTTGTNNNNSISIYGMAFPSSTTVKKGATVTWTNNDPMAHTVTSDDGTTFSSGSISPGASFSYVANTIGSFPYHCNFHSYMTSTLKVVE